MVLQLDTEIFYKVKSSNINTLFGLRSGLKMLKYHHRPTFLHYPWRMEILKNLVSTSFEEHLAEEACEKFVNSLAQAPQDTTLRINKNASNTDSLIKELNSVIGNQVYFLPNA